MLYSEKPEGWTWDEWSDYVRIMTGAVEKSEENNYDTWNYEGHEDDYEDDYDDEEDDRYQVIDADGHTLVFDPDNHTYGVTPIIEQYLKWTNFSRPARWLIILIARVDRAVLKLRNRRRWGLLKARAAHDDIPF